MTGDSPSKSCLLAYNRDITYKKCTAFAKGQGPDRSSGVRGSWWCEEDETDTAPKPRAHNRRRREKGCGTRAKGGQSYCEIRSEFRRERREGKIEIERESPTWHALRQNPPESSTRTTTTIARRTWARNLSAGASPSYGLQPPPSVSSRLFRCQLWGTRLALIPQDTLAA